MKKSAILFILVIFLLPAYSQKTPVNGGGGSTSEGTEFQFEYLIVSGSFGGGGVLSTNVINSGGVLPASIDFLLQQKRQRFGFGVTGELYLTPENLFTLGYANTEKYYFMYEATVFKNSPVNLGVSCQFGGFYIGGERKDEFSEKVRLFGNAGVIAEVGFPRFYLFTRPYIEYKSYGEKSWHKEILVVAMVGFRWKIKEEALNN